MKIILQSVIPCLTGEQLDKFECYYELLIYWNTKVNLTSITDPQEVAKKHFADSLAALPLLSRDVKIIDVGTGAGFPGVPLLIVRPELRLTLCDSLNKRISFLSLLLDKLDLRAECVHSRAEDLGQDPKYREKYDFALTRAVASLPVLLEFTLPLCRVGGKSVCYKGEADGEIRSAQNATRILHGNIETIPVDADWGVRNLVVCTKNAPTDRRYPRKAGTPQREPL